MEVVVDIVLDDFGDVNVLGMRSHICLQWVCVKTGPQRALGKLANGTEATA
jgi:hypothetical protein